MSNKRINRYQNNTNYYLNPPHISEEGFKYLDAVLSPSFAVTRNKIKSSYSGHSETFIAGINEGLELARAMLEDINDMFWENDEEDF